VIFVCTFSSSSLCSVTMARRLSFSSVSWTSKSLRCMRDSARMRSLCRYTRAVHSHYTIVAAAAAAAAVSHHSITQLKTSMIALLSRSRTTRHWLLALITEMSTTNNIHGDFAVGKSYEFLISCFQNWTFVWKNNHRQDFLQENVPRVQLSKLPAPR